MLRPAIGLLLFLHGPLAWKPLAAAEPTDERPVTLHAATQFDLQSRNGRTYRIFISLPDGEEPAAGRPVIYLSDANGNFPIMATLARRRTRSGGGAVVVGIGYPSDDRQVQAERRTYDLTSQADEQWLETQPRQPGFKTGGNDEFLEMIEKEVKPLVQSRTKIDRTRQMLFGHSYGGLLVLHALFTRPESYQYYAASSPSIWFNNRSILAEEKAFLEKYAGKKLAAAVWLTVGENEQPSPGAGGERNKFLEETRQGANAAEMADRLNKTSIEGLTASYELLPGEDHGSAVFPAMNLSIRKFVPAR